MSFNYAYPLRWRSMAHAKSTSITGQTPLMTTKEVAAYLNVAAGVLYRWRREGKGPRSIQFPRGYRYRREDVEHWLEEQAHQ